MDHYQDLAGKNIYTPWGKADYSETKALGIVFYATPSHGGFKLSETRQEEMPEEWRSRDSYYEEDCEWCVVALTFPDLFNEFERECAQATYDRSYAGGFIALRQPQKHASSG